LLRAADAMCVAARTAPKAKGVDVIKTCVISGDDLEKLAVEMERLAEVLGYPFFVRDAGCVRRSGAVVLIHSDSMYAALDPAMLLQYIPNAQYTGTTAAEYANSAGMGAAGSTCPLHTPWWHTSQYDSGELQNAKNAAQNLINEVNRYLNSVQTLPDAERNTLVQGVADLQSYISAGLPEYITRATEQLRYSYNTMREQHPPVGVVW